MKSKKKDRLTALFLCAVMVAATVLSNSSYVFAADQAEGALGLPTEEITSEGVGAASESGTDIAAAAQDAEQAAEDEVTEPDHSSTEDAKATEPPQDTEEPAATETPIVPEEPEITEEPVVTEEPVITEEPTVPEEISEEAAAPQLFYTFENDDMIVEVNLPEGTVLPEGTQLHIRQITDHKISENSTEEEKADKSSFDDISHLLKETADDNGNPVDGFYAYHVEFLKDGEVYVPEGEMNVKVSYRNGALPEEFTGDSKLKAMNVKAFNYTTAKDENHQDITVVQDLKDHLTAFTFADSTAGSVQEIGFNASKVTDFIVAWNGQDQTTQYTYSDDEVQVTAALSQVGLLPRGVELKVTKVEDEDTLAGVKDKLEEQQEAERELEGFVAYDIRFEKDGEEIEPTGDVNVSLEFINAAKPEHVEEKDSDDSEDRQVEVYHLKEDDSSETTAEKLEEANVEMAGDTEVTKAEFVTNSFSIFTITWNLPGKNWAKDFPYKLNVHLVDMEGNLIDIEDTEVAVDVSSSKKQTDTTIKNVAPVISGYSFYEAVIEDDEINNEEHRAVIKGVAPWYRTEGKTIIHQMHYKAEEAGNTLLKDDLDDEGNGSAEVYFYYVNTSGDSIEPITDTVDNAGIDLTLYDYDNGVVNKGHALKFNNGNGSPSYNKNQSGVTQGIVSSTLDENARSKTYGNPKVTIDGKNDSLDYLFGEGGDAVNNLFRNVDGYYYFNSDENFAQYDGKDNFILYNVAGAPTGDSAAFKKGNFFPFNTLSTENDFKGVLTPSGSRLFNFEKSKGKELLNNKANVHFGMKMDTMFSQPAKGKINGNDMVFEFSGDDDVWVYIDGVLVLDIGGIHPANAGSVNFSNGVVKVSGKDTLSLADIFKAAKGEEYVEKNFTEEGTFKNFSEHNLRFYYLERGAGASNCKLKFNIQPIPKDGFSVEKQISNIDEGAYNDVEFTFKVRVDQNGDGKLTEEDIYAGEGYVLKDANGNKIEDGTTGKDGSLILKHGQKAVFDGVDAGTLYDIEETGVTGKEYDQIEIQTSLRTDTVDPDKSEEGVKTDELTIGENFATVFSNRCAATNMKQLVIEKKLIGNSDDTFQMKVTVGGGLYNGSYKVGATYNEAVNQESKNTANGIIEMKAGQVAVVLGNVEIESAGEIKRGIPSGTTFKAEEVGLDQKFYGEPEFNASSAADIEVVNGYDGFVSGTIKIDSNAKAVVTNTGGKADFMFRKTNNSGQRLEGARFKIADDSGYIQEITTAADGTAMFVGFPYGTYTLEETEAPSGYEKRTEKWTLKVTLMKDGDTKTELFEEDGTLVEKQEGEYVIVNYLPGEQFEKSLDYEKTVKLKDWDERTYNINLTSSFIGSVGKSVTADVTDVIDARFELAEGERERLNNRTGAKIKDNSDGSTTITWPNANIKSANGDTPGWEEKITVRAKDEFIGGNDVYTNAEGSGISNDRGSVTFDPVPVNVKIDYTVGNAEDVIFWGDNINSAKTEIHTELFDSKKVTGLYADKTAGKKYTIGRDGKALNTDDFTLKWSKDKEKFDDNSVLTKEQIGDEKPDEQTAYYLQVKYTAAGDATKDSNANTTDASGKSHKAEEASGLYATNSQTGLSEKNASYYKDGDKAAKYGVYIIDIVKGQLEITKEINSQYTDIGQIKANQSFIFRVDRREETAGDIKDTYYAVLSFDANGNVITGTDKITGLKKGYYTVTEETKWSSKYTKTGTTDNYSTSEAHKVAENLPIGERQGNEALMDKAGFYGTAPGYEDYAAANPAKVTFTNTLKGDWKWLSDVASAVNEFTVKN